jgi:hypothetical protein
MRSIRLALMALLALCSLVHARPVDLAPSGAPGAYDGFRLTTAGGQQAQLWLQLGARWRARHLERRDEAGRLSIELSDFDVSGTGGTPTLGAGSFVRLSAGADDPWPTLDFRLAIDRFDPAAWRAALGQPAPLSFLALPLDSARLWYVHGLLCPTPRFDPYPLTRATIRGSWAEGWSYGAALGALTVPAMALWDDRSGHMVGYEWAGARLTDKSDKDLGIAFVNAVPGWAHPCLTLLSNAQADWTNLTDPITPLTVGTHLRVMLADHLDGGADPNRLVLQRIYHDYPSLLPAAPAMNDLSWMVDRGLDELGVSGPSGGAFLHTVPKEGWGWEQFFYDGGTVTYADGFRGVDQMYRRHDAPAAARFESELATFLAAASWEDVDGDHCCHWRFPLSGSWKTTMGGEAADTVHNVQQFGVGAAMLACWANTRRADLLPYLDGLYQWARHGLFTRGEIADIPESMFTLQATTLAGEFLLNYHRLFADDADPGRRARAAQAFDLAHVVIYRNANVTIGDSDERDNLSGAFMMPGNMAKFWLGQVSNAELGLPFRAMIEMHVETGDPVFKWLVRGALDRWWIGYTEDCWHTYENLDIWGVSSGAKGTPSGIHGPCDDFWEWAQPVGDATLRVVVGQKAALAFCRGTRALDVDQYAYQPPAGFRFRVARVAPGAVPDRFSIIVSSPWRDLSGLPVKMDGVPVAEADRRVLGTYREHLYLRGVKEGSRIEIGDVSAAQPLPLPAVPGPERAAPAEALAFGARRFSLARLPADAPDLPATWSGPDAWAGLPVGWQASDGVPYQVDAHALRPGAKLAVTGREVYLFGVADQPGALTVTSGGQTTAIDPREGLEAARGWPLCRWKLMLYAAALPAGEGVITVGEGGLLLGATTLAAGPPLADELRRRATAPNLDEARLAELVKEAKTRLGAANRTPIGFLPPFGDTFAPLSAWAERLDLDTVMLSPQDLVAPGVLDPRRLPVLVYTGNEDYVRSVLAPGDAERALLGYLHAGGTLIVAGTCRPFTYGRDLQAPPPPPDAKPEWALLSNRFELPLLGPGETRPDAIGFEQPPPGVKLTLRTAPGQDMLWSFPAERPFPTAGDQRYRPFTATGLDPADEVKPIVSTFGSDGKAYGAAAVVVNHHCAAFRDAQVMWAWGTLLRPPFEQRDQVAAGLLSYALAHARPASQPLPDNLSCALPPGERRVAVLPPDCGGRESILKDACRATGATPVFLTPDQFVTSSHFNAANYPVAVQAVTNESFIEGYRGANDGEETYKRYLKQGGTLIVCQSATPLYYELTWDGRAFHSRPPQRFWSMAFELGFETNYGWEKPPAPVRLELTDAGRALWPNLPARLDLDYLTDQRWRPLTAYRSSAARDFTPLAWLVDAGDGHRIGLAAARIDFHDSQYKGARVFALWGNAVVGEVGEKMLAGCVGVR